MDSLASTGTAQDFGNLTKLIYKILLHLQIKFEVYLLVDQIQHPNYYAIIDYITISSTGDGQDFGDLNQAGQFACGCFSNSTRGVFGGGINSRILQHQLILLQLQHWKCNRFW